jgi:hypothetical protein
MVRSSAFRRFRKIVRDREMFALGRLKPELQTLSLL